MLLFQLKFGSHESLESGTAPKISKQIGNVILEVDNNFNGLLKDPTGKTLVKGDIRKESFWNEVKQLTTTDVYNELRRWADEVMRLIQMTFKAKGGTNMGIWAERISIFFKKRDEEEQRKTEGMEKGKESVLEETSIGSKKGKAA